MKDVQKALGVVKLLKGASAPLHNLGQHQVKDNLQCEFEDGTKAIKKRE
mgnify:CR=1 FL=1|jgi:hypothetical protein